MVFDERNANFVCGDQAFLFGLEINEIEELLYTCCKNRKNDKLMTPMKIVYNNIVALQGETVAFANTYYRFDMAITDYQELW